MPVTEPQDPDALPVRRHIPSRRESAPPLVVQPQYDGAAILETLKGIRGLVDRITGLLVATHDGLAVCGDFGGIDNDSVAALCAAAVGLAGQFTKQAQVGEPQAAMFEGESGYVCVFPVESPLLLVVFGAPDTTMGLFTVAAKQALALLRQDVVRQRVRSVRNTRRAYFEHHRSFADDQLVMEER